MAKQYLENLEKNGFIAEEYAGSRIIYRTTSKGSLYREKFDRLQSDLDGLYAIGD
jgi:predicted transcriptional regulator